MNIFKTIVGQIFTLQCSLEMGKKEVDSGTKEETKAAGKKK